MNDKYYKEWLDKRDKTPKKKHPNINSKKNET